MDETVREVGAKLLAVTAVDFSRDTAMVEFAKVALVGWMMRSKSKAFVFKVTTGTLFQLVLLC